MSISLFSLMSVILPLCQYKYNLSVHREGAGMCNAESYCFALVLTSLRIRNIRVETSLQSRIIRKYSGKRSVHDRRVDAVLVSYFTLFPLPPISRPLRFFGS